MFFRLNCWVVVDGMGLPSANSSVTSAFWGFNENRKCGGLVSNYLQELRWLATSANGMNRLFFSKETLLQGRRLVVRDWVGSKGREGLRIGPRPHAIVCRRRNSRMRRRGRGGGILTG